MGGWRPAVVLVLVVSAGCVDLRRPDLVRLVDGGDPIEDGGDPTDGPGDDDGPLDPGDGPPDAPEPLPAGARCARPDQCGSGFCAQEHCCDEACAGTCYACNLPGAMGTCTAVPAGEDPGQGCAEEPLLSCGLDGTCDGAGACRRYPARTECRPGRCTAGMEYAASACDGSGAPCPEQTVPSACASGMCTDNSCAASCSGDGACQAGFFCNAGRCAAKLNAGAACSREGQCMTGHCVDGVCCSSACTELCFACNTAAGPGTCRAVASGEDPRAVCPAEAAAGCGRAGGCNGAGACRLHPGGTVCVGGSCAGGSETPARTCDGVGTCGPSAAPRACHPYGCGASACAATCVDSTGCTPGFSCVANACVRSPGLALFWRFEESSGLTVPDDSGNGRSGLAVGSTGTPTPSTTIPALVHANTRSRQFSGSGRQAVQIPLSSALRPENDFSLAVWYRATGVDSSGAATGSEIISGGNVYILRLRPNHIEFSKSVDSGGPIQCKGDAPGYLDGRWHHLAATASGTAGTRIYYDGVQKGFLSNTQSLDFDKAPPSNANLFVGRHGNGETQWDFTGNLDEVRIYTRVLSAAEIQTLAAGRNL